MQKTWLKDSLKASEAIFKIIISGSGWSNSKGPGGDSWASFLSERNELFDYIRDEKVEGVLLLSGDTHIGELNTIPWSENGGYDMYDLVSSPLAQNPSDSGADNRPELRIRKPESTSANFGLLRFDFHERPVATFKLIDEFGRYSWSPFKIFADELKNGVTSWRRTIDPVELERQKEYF
jgi:alkaline phosphatase D